MARRGVPPIPSLKVLWARKRLSLFTTSSVTEGKSFRSASAVLSSAAMCPAGGASGLEAVPDAPDGDDAAGVVGILLELAPEAADVLRDGGVRLPVRRRAPYLLEELLPGEDLAGRAGQEGEQVELL